MRLQADYNAAQTIRARGFDKEITRFMSVDQVHAVLMERTAKFLKQYGMSLDDAVKANWLDAKHKARQCLRERCTG